MAIFLIVSYLTIIIYSLFTKKKLINVLWLNLIGISVQFCWEFALLINGIRPFNEASIQTILINSLIETNLGLPSMYLIYLGVNKFFNEDLTRKKMKIDKEEPIKIETTD